MGDFLSDAFHNGLLLEVIERGLDSLGESPKKAVWIVLEEQFNIDRNEIPLNINEITNALQNIFGLGYNFLDTLFKQNLEDATGKVFKNKNFSESVGSLEFVSDSQKTKK